MITHPHPKTVTTEIIRDYPARFVIEETELRRLVVDINSLLKPETADQFIKIRYWIGLKNGIIYEIDNIDTLFSEENSQDLTILVFIILAELLDRNNKQIRRIIVHFSRGKRTFSSNELKADSGEFFNLEYHGMSYRIKERNRDAALKMIDVIESRLNKFKRWYSGFQEIRVNPIVVAFNLSTSIIVAFLLYGLAVATPEINSFFRSSDGNYDSPQIIYIPRFTSDFLIAIAFVMIFVVFGVIIAALIIRALNWMIPPSIVAIGDEKQTYKRALKIREGIFWTVIVGGIVSAIVNYLI